MGPLLAQAYASYMLFILLLGQCLRKDIGDHFRRGYID